MKFVDKLLNRLRFKEENTFAKQLLNEGSGSPGDTARAITRTFIVMKESTKESNNEIFRKILNFRSMLYSQIGINILNPELINRIIINSENELVFLITADVFFSNTTSPANIKAFQANFDLIFDVVVENYNNMVNPHMRLLSASNLKEKIKLFIDEEMNRQITSHEEVTLDSELLLDKANVAFDEERFDVSQSLLEMYFNLNRDLHRVEPHLLYLRSLFGKRNWSIYQMEENENKIERQIDFINQNLKSKFNEEQRIQFGALVIEFHMEFKHLLMGLNREIEERIEYGGNLYPDSEEITRLKQKYFKH